MTNLLWPGDQRAGQLLSDSALCRALVSVEAAWLGALAGNGLIPTSAADAVSPMMVGEADLEALAIAADRSANPVIPLVELLRQRVPEPARRWVHRGLTSQDVLDSALMMMLRDAKDRLLSELSTQIGYLMNLAQVHRGTAMVARTLTQPAIPITFGVKAAAWLSGVCDAADALAKAHTPVQIGGAAGTLAAVAELAALTSRCADPGAVARRLAEDTASALGLHRRAPWHTARAPITTLGDALTACTDAWGRIAADIVILGRPEIGEVTEATESGRGGSSTMPDKANPVLSVLVRRAALAAPPQAATLHLAAAMTNDERADGAWHAEWDTLRTLGRRTLVAASHTTDLLAGLRIHPDRMAANLAAVDVSGEQRVIAELVDKSPSIGYLGAAETIIDDALACAARWVGDNS